MPEHDIPPSSWGADVSLQQQGRQRDQVEEEVEDIPHVDDVERGDDIPLRRQDATQRQHVWGAGVSLGRQPFNPHAINPVIHAESAAEAAEARLRTLPRLGTVGFSTVKSFDHVFMSKFFCSYYYLIL